MAKLESFIQTLSWMLGLYVAVTQPQKYTKKSKDDVEHEYGEDKIRSQNHFVD